jgi:hypothetical protein
MTFSHLNRRLHLYLAMSLLPWFLMYAASSFAFSHGDYFEERDRAKGVPLMTKRFERSYDIDVPAEGDLKAVGARIVRDNGIEGSFGAYRQSPDEVDVYVYTFLHSMQLKYFVREKRLVAEDRRFRFDHFLTGMHARGGFEGPGLLEKTWGVVVDLVCLGMLLWIATGLYMWWKLRATRGWGWLALLGGFASFGLLLWRL